MLLLTLACRPDDPERPRRDPGDPDAETTADTDEATEPSTSADCGALAPMPEQGTPVPAFVPGEYAAVHEDFTFSPDGNLVSVHRFDTVLQAATVDGLVVPLVPGFHSDIKGTAWMADGRIALVDPTVGALRLVDPETGGQEVVGSGLSAPNGVTVGPGGDLFVTAIGGVFQIDEQGGVSLAAELPGADLDGIAFSPDHEVMYADVPSGIILRSVRQPDGHWEPLAPFATVPFDAFELVFDIADGMVTDVCGNLYVVGMHGALLRFTPDGALDGVTSLPVAPYELFSAVRFGLGAGGFDAETAYVTSLQGAVIEVPLGVRGTPR
jgi:hypothetical protein